MLAVHSMDFPGWNPGSLQIRYVDMPMGVKPNEFDPHTHEECEIYINLSGNVSFMVEKYMYPIMPGSVIITRPQEVHHCIYHSREGNHKHFWILFSAQGNEGILRRFFDRPAGCDNLILLSAEALEEVKHIGFSLLEEQGILDRCSLFLRLLSLLERDEFSETGKNMAVLLPDVKFALDYIYENMAFPITIESIAARAHVSVNTLERHFLSAIQVSPTEFIKQRRLSKAQAMLKNGASVLETSQSCGFSDCSRFISLFKKQMGMTPLQFKKNDKK